MQKSNRNGVVLMNVERLTGRITLRPSERKMKRAKYVAEHVLPKIISENKNAKPISLSDKMVQLGKSIRASFDNITKRCP